MHTKTLEDLAKIKHLEEKIAHTKNEIKKIKNSCNHRDRVPMLVETLKYDFTPSLSCVVCYDEYTRGDGAELSDDQVIKLYKDALQCFSCFELYSECECEEGCDDRVSDILKNHPNGFRFPPTGF